MQLGSLKKRFGLIYNPILSSRTEVLLSVYFINYYVGSTLNSLCCREGLGRKNQNRR